MDDWKKHTDYRGYQESDQVIQDFWKVIRTWDAEQKSRLLQFATGTSRIPVNGFKDLQGSDGPRRFTIEKAGEVNALPKSHTWYVRTNQFAGLKLTFIQFQPTRPATIQVVRCSTGQIGNCCGGNTGFWTGVNRCENINGHVSHPSKLSSGGRPPFASSLITAS